MGLELIKLEGKLVEAVCRELKEKHPDWILLDEDYLKTIDSDKLPEQKTFIVPGYLVNKKLHQKKSTILISYLMVTSRQRENSFYVVAESWEEVDLRIRRYIRASAG